MSTIYGPRFSPTKHSKRLGIIRCSILIAGVSVFLLTPYGSRSESPVPPQRPQPGVNNVWYEYNNNSDTVFVFVHGILSDSRDAWYHEPDTNAPAGAYWPELIRQDERLGRPSIFLGGFYTAPDSGAYSIRDAANQLYQALVISLDPADEPVLSKPNILFITHSTGGIVLRHMLVKRLFAFKDKTVGVLLIASPSVGSRDADRLDWLAALARQRMGGELQWDHPFLEELDRDFKNLVNERQIPNLVGAEAIENHFVVKWLGFLGKEVLVESHSAGRYFGEPIRLPNTDHFGAAKPSTFRDAAHLFLREFYETKFTRLQSTGVGMPALQPSSIKLTRLVSPPGSDGEPTLTTAWLTATGDEIYYVDSATITHHPGAAESVGTGAQAPDAEYSFTFSYGSKTQHPLIPALRIDPADKRELSFTLGLAPRGPFSTVDGFVSVVLHYHTSSGREGTLLLGEPNPDAAFLADLLQMDVAIKIDAEDRGYTFSQVITPSGVQRGADLRSDDALTYERLELPSEIYSPERIPSGPLSVPGFSSRQRLNSAIVEKGKERDVVNLVARHPLGWDLCTGLPSDECGEALRTAVPDGNALEALAIRHLIHADGSLAKFVIDNTAENWSYSARFLGGALFIAPAGDWQRALLSLVRADDGVLDLLYLRREEIRPELIDKVEEAAREALAKGHASGGASRLLTWATTVEAGVGHVRPDRPRVDAP